MFKFINSWFSPKKTEERSTSVERQYTMQELANSGLLGSYDTLSIPGLYRGVKLVADLTAKLPYTKYKKTSTDSRVPDTKHPTFRLLRRPNKLDQTPAMFKSQIVLHCLTHGNYYGLIIRNDDFEPVEILPLDPRYVSLIWINGVVMYCVSIAGKVDHYFPHEIIHVKGLQADNYRGYSVLDLFAKSFGYSMSLQDHGYNYFKNGSNVKNVIYVPNDIWNNEKKRTDLMTFMAKGHEGTRNSGRDMYVHEAMKVQTESTSNESSQYIQTKESDLVTMANIIGCPPSFLGVKGSSSYNSLEMDKQFLLDFCLDGWLNAIEEELMIKLFTTDEYDSGDHYIEFNRKAFVGTDPEAEQKLLITYYQNGIFAWEEVRQRLNMDTDRNESWCYVRLNTLSDPDKVAETASNSVQNAPQGDNNPPDAIAATDAPTGATVDEARSLGLATVDRLCRRLMKSNARPLDHLSVFEESLPHLKAECKDILTEINDGYDKNTKIERINMLRGELCQII